jgi:hypothetical protein
MESPFHFCLLHLDWYLIYWTGLQLESKISLPFKQHGQLQQLVYCYLSYRLRSEIRILVFEHMSALRIHSSSYVKCIATYRLCLEIWQVVDNPEKQQKYCIHQQQFYTA